jgi:hypothetical protein
MKLGIAWWYLLFVLINHKSSYYASAKSLETQNAGSCEHVSEFFKSLLNITIQPTDKPGKCPNLHPHKINRATRHLFIAVYCLSL